MNQAGQAQGLNWIYNKMNQAKLRVWIEETDYLGLPNWVWLLLGCVSNRKVDS